LHLSEPNAAVVALFHGKAATHHRAIVTSASRPNAENVLRHMGLLQDVELLLAADDIARPKPHPEGFLKAMRHFAIGPEATEIYEDSATGLAAARATGALVVDVKSLDLK